MTHEDDLRADVARNSGRARAIPLLRLGQHLGMEYWRLGPGQPVAGPSLDEAILVFDEALDLLDPELPLHPQTAGMVGWLVGSRHLAHGGPAGDRERGVALLESAIAASQLAPAHATIARLVLGQLLTMGALTGGAVNPLTALSGSAAGSAALDRAEAVLRPLVEAGHGLGHLEQAAEMAQALLDLAGIARALTGGITGLLGAGPARLVEQAREVQLRLARTARVTLRPDQFFFADDLAGADPLDRPHAVVVDATPDAPAPTSTAPPARPRATADPLRVALLERMPGGGVAGLVSIIDGHAPQPEIDTVDRWVALGSTLVEARGAVDTDRVLFAAALYLRSLVDGGGWADDDTDDVRAAATSLAAVGTSLLAEAPETLAAALRLATIIDERRPALRLRSGLSEHLGL